MPEDRNHRIDSHFGEDTFQGKVFRRLEQMPEDFRAKWWPIYDPEDPPKVKKYFYPAALAAMIVHDNWTRMKSIDAINENKQAG